MSKSKIDATSRKAHGLDKANHSSHHGSPGFFNQSHPPASLTTRPPRQRPQAVPPPMPEIRLRTPTEFLLAAILDELKMRNALEFRKQQVQTDKEEAELQAAQKMEELDKAHFENDIRPTMFL